MLVLEKMQAKPGTLQKVTLLHRYFSSFLNWTSGTILRKASSIKDPIFLVLSSRFSSNIQIMDTVWNVSKYGVFCGPYFPAFGLNTERYFVSLRIQSECGKIRTRKNSVFGHFLHSAYTYVLAKILQISSYKNWPLVSKITRGVWTALDKQWKVQKVEIRWATFVQKYIPSVKTSHTEDLSNITFNCLCKNSPTSLCHFWNHKSFFTTQLLYISLAETLHTFCESNPSKCKFPHLLLLFKLCITFSVMRHNSSVLFHLNLSMFCTKGAHQSANFQTFQISHEN